jgi:resuscitation-promoting factor RpfB
MPILANASVDQDVPAGPSRRPLASLVLSAILLPLIGFPPSVLVDVDGTPVVARAASSSVETVADVIEVAGVELGTHDLVLPALDAPVEPGLEVRVARAVDVTLIVNDGAPLAVITADATAGGIVRAAGLVDTVVPQARTVPGWAEPVRDGDVIRLTVPASYVVHVDGEIHSGHSLAATVGDLLEELGVERSLLDRVEPSATERLERGTTVTVRRVELREVRRETVLPREVERIEDPNVLRGQVRVAQAGRTGLRVDVEQVLLVEGEVESRTLVSSTVTREPVTRIERVGVRALDGETIWDALARCESGSRWDIVRRLPSGLAYYGGLQFHPDTWNRNRPADFPALASQATREQQIQVAERVQQRQGWGAWPACARRLGLR